VDLGEGLTIQLIVFDIWCALMFVFMVFEPYLRSDLADGGVVVSSVFSLFNAAPADQAEDVDEEKEEATEQEELDVFREAPTSRTLSLPLPRCALLTPILLAADRELTWAPTREHCESLAALAAWAAFPASHAVQLALGARRFPGDWVG
jgi:hypothetical protein